MQRDQSDIDIETAHIARYQKRGRRQGTADLWNVQRTDLSSSEFFSALQGRPGFSEFVATLYSNMVKRTVPQGSWLMVKGDADVHEAFWLTRGFLDVFLGVDDSSAKVATILPGNWVGESGLHGSAGAVRTASVKVVRTDCELLVLDSKGFRSILGQFPQLQRDFEANLRSIADERGTERDQRATEVMSFTRRQEDLQSRGRTLFDKLDVNRSGRLDRSELAALPRKLGQLESAVHGNYFDRMLMMKKYAGDGMPGASGTDEYTEEFVDWATFLQWWQEYQRSLRRKSRRKVQELFNECDDDGSGGLDRQELDKLAAVVSKTFKWLLLDPPLQPLPKGDWDRMVHLEAVEAAQRDPSGVDDAQAEPIQVSFGAFQMWWKERTYDDEPNIPVLPEYMVQQLRDVRIETDGDVYMTGDDGDPLSPRKQQTRSGRELWGILRPRLKLIASLQRLWGNVHELYAASAQSQHEFTTERLPCGMRHPNSVFSTFWDSVQVVFLIWVSAMVPLRVCFDVTVDPLTVTWWLDVILDAYFITDVILNFRTAIYDENTGLLETNRGVIAKKYLMGWFTIDFVSCLPIPYIEMLITATSGTANSSTNNEGGGGTRLVKVLRLLRLSKMLRLARIKKILSKYEDTINLAPVFNVALTLGVILLTTHLLACGYYLVGSDNELTNDGTTIYGWVQNYDTGLGWGRYWSPSLGTKWVVSMYMAFRGGHAFTTIEFVFSMLSELVVGFIYGALAGLMANMAANSNVAEAEKNGRMMSLKAWIKDRGISKMDQNKIFLHFNNQFRSNAVYNEAAILDELPPALAADICYKLYGNFVQRIPLFRDLGKEVLHHLCKLVTHQVFSAGQQIFEQGHYGSELYFIIEGEVEVIQNGHQLGFLGESSFFGESPIIEAITAKSGAGDQIRKRTVRATTTCRVGMVRKGGVVDLLHEYPELSARLQRFCGYSRIKAKALNASKIKEGLTAIVQKSGAGDVWRAVSSTAGMESTVPAQSTPPSGVTTGDLNVQHQLGELQMAVRRIEAQLERLVNVVDTRSAGFDIMHSPGAHANGASPVGLRTELPPAPAPTGPASVSHRSPTASRRRRHTAHTTPTLSQDVPASVGLLTSGLSTPAVGNETSAPQIAGMHQNPRSPTRRVSEPAVNSRVYVTAAMQARRRL
jgi:CRP-like cAMP-binding protein